jgi:hypothetical protein
MGWKILTKLRCCPRHATAIVAPILVVHLVETGRDLDLARTR